MATSLFRRLERLARCILVLAVAFITPINTRAVEDELPRNTPSASVERILWWLPPGTETLIVAQGPFEIPMLPDDDAILRRNFVELARILPMGPLPEIEGGTLWKDLHGQKVLLAIGGSRRFRAPAGLGSMPYEGCHIVQFDESSHDAVRRAFQSCRERAPETIRLVGTETAVFQEKWENDVWSLFIAQPEAGLLLCATDRAYLETVLQRRARKSDPRDLPADLPEWRHVDTKAPVWAVRHYRADNAQQDPSSPLNRKAAGIVPDPKAVGFVFWYDSLAETAKARYLSESPNALQLAVRGWHHPTEELTPEIAQVAPGVIEISASLRDPEARSSFGFILLWNLGHGVFV